MIASSSIDAIVVAVISLLLLVLVEPNQISADNAGPTYSRRRRNRKRKSFAKISKRWNDRQFRRRLRMEKTTFNRLCQTIKFKVGRWRFKSDNDLYVLHRAGCSDRGGAITGEVKVALFLRVLAGSSYLDVADSFDIYETNVMDYFYEVVDWVNETFEFEYDVQNFSLLRKISWGFSKFSNNVLEGCIGAIDGIAIRIRRPYFTEVPDPGNYFCRKGFFAVNVQAIVDSKCRFLWFSPYNIGSANDGRAFQETGLWKDLEGLQSELADQGFWLAGDSAYPLRSFLCIPYDNATFLSDEDNFNFWLSNSRIRVECAFGMFIMRWGLFWRKLKIEFSKIGPVISAAMLIQNFIIDDEDDTMLCDHIDWRDFYPTHKCLASDVTLSLLQCSTRESIVGRPSLREREMRDRGVAFRDGLKRKLRRNKLSRLTVASPKYNCFGHVYFT